MTLLTTFAACLYNGMAITREVAAITTDAAGSTGMMATDNTTGDTDGTTRNTTAASNTGTQLDELFTSDDATALRHLATIYFGPTSATGYQRTAITAAETQQHSIDDLLRIERHTRGLTHNNAWKLRAHLCAVPGETIDTEARAQLKQLRPTPAPKLGAHIRRGTGNAPDTLIYRGASREVTWLYERLENTTPTQAFTNASTGSGIPASADSDTDSVAGNGAGSSTSRSTGSDAGSGTGLGAGGGDGAGPAYGSTVCGSAAGAIRYNLGDSRNTTPEATVHIVITVDDIKNLTYDGDEVMMTMTNGARITGADWAAMRLHEVGFVTLLDPVEGPVNLYRTQRFPNLKQRLMAAAESPLCRWPECRQPASRSRIHHLTAWKNGGDTNASNLTVLCDYHNGVNNDDPETVTTGRGHLERQPGGITWVPS